MRNTAAPGATARILLSWLLLAIFAVAAPVALAAEVTLRSFGSKAMNADYKYTIYLPDGYESGRLRYPVLFLLHGNGGDENDWLVNGRVQATMDALIREAKVQASIIVMPGAGSTWWVDGNKDKAESALIKELIPHIDATFRTISAREGRMIAGLSAGGFGTVSAVFRYPELFIAGAALSPAIYSPTPPSHSSAMRVAPFQKDGKFDRPRGTGSTTRPAGTPTRAGKLLFPCTSTVVITTRFLLPISRRYCFRNCSSINRNLFNSG